LIGVIHFDPIGVRFALDHCGGRRFRFAIGFHLRSTAGGEKDSR
jgi:hypothetical protein